ncbi:MAG: GAF domain-containing protein [Anaerolineae bacterium]|nr:GAF domain-containing protein [Anaerolineae bacterium]MCA9891946.1 GAF domain-containing protein [Anaerolineae bacterium]
MLALFGTLSSGVEVLGQQSTLIALGMGTFVTSILMWKRSTKESLIFTITAIMVLGSHIAGGLLVLLAGVLIGTGLQAAIDKPHVGSDQQVPTLLWSAVYVVATVGIGALAIFGILLLANVTTPINFADITAIGIAVIAVFVGYILAQIVGMVLVADDNPNRVLARPGYWIEVAIFTIGSVAIALAWSAGGVLILIGLLALATYQFFRTGSTVDFAPPTTITRHQDELTILNRISKNINDDMMVDDMLLHVYQDVRSVFMLDVFYVATLENDYKTMTFQFVMKNGEHEDWGTKAIDKGYIGQVVEQKKTLHITLSNQHRFPALDPTPPEHQLAAYVGMPLIVGDSLYGVMAIGHSSNPRAYSEEDVLLFETIGTQTSVAIRNAITYQQTMQMAQHMSFINTSLHDVMFNIDRSESLRTACEIALNLSNTDKAAIFVYDDDAQADVSAAVGFAEGIVPPDWQTVANTELPTDGIINISDISQFNENVQAAAKKSQFVSTLSVPLKSGMAHLGSLNVYHDTPRHYSASEISLLEMLANQVTAALDNAELLRALELYASEQAQLVELSRSSSAQLELEQIVLRINEILEELFAFTKIDIALKQVNKAEGILLTSDVSQRHVTRSYRELTRIPEFEKSLDSLRFFVYTWQSDDPNLSDAMRELMEQVGDVVRFAAPLIINQEVIGILQMRSDEPRTLSPNDVRLLEMATNQISFQLFNARRYNEIEEELVQRLGQLAALEGIAIQIAQSLDKDIILRNVLEAAMSATQASKSVVGLLQHGTELQSTVHEIINDRFTQRQELYALNANPVLAEVVQEGQDRLHNDLQAEEGATSGEDDPLATLVYRSSLAVPLQYGGKNIGVLQVQSLKPNAFSTEQAGFLKNLATHAAISITNSSMLDERQQQVTMLQRLRDMTLSAVETLNQNEIIRVITRESLIVLDGYESALYFYDEHPASLIQVTGFVREGAENARESEPHLPEALIMKAISEQMVLYITDIGTNAIYQSDDMLSHVHHKSAVVMPIIRRNTIKEVLCITFAEVKDFDTELRNTVELLSQQVSRHLEIIYLSETLKSQNDQMGTILRASRDGLALLDRAGIVQAANAAAEQLIGLSVDTEYRESFAEVLANNMYPDDPVAANAYVDKISGLYRASAADNQDREYAITRRDGHTLYIKETHTPITGENNSNLVARLVTLRDQTEEKELELYRQKVQSMVIHDLRSPLSSIISSMYMVLALLEAEGDSVDENLVPSIQVSLESANQLLHLVDSMRDIERMGKGELPLDLQDLPAEYILEQASDALATSLSEANLTIETQLEPDLPFLKVDNDLIRRVFINLLQNAYKFTPSGGRIMVGAYRSDEDRDMVRLFVNDTGPGIPVEMRERVFEQYEQITTQKPYQGDKGSGLGLHFCKLAIEAHGGRIWIADEGPLSGANFVFTLPIAKSTS